MSHSVGKDRPGRSIAINRSGSSDDDRPHLRPVFDAALPALPGPVTVQARGTLVSPCRTVFDPSPHPRHDLR